jgi:hypothetical protein
MQQRFFLILIIAFTLPFFVNGQSEKEKKKKEINSILAELESVEAAKVVAVAKKPNVDAKFEAVDAEKVIIEQKITIHNDNKPLGDLPEDSPQLIRYNAEADQLNKEKAEIKSRWIPAHQEKENIETEINNADYEINSLRNRIKLMEFDVKKFINPGCGTMPSHDAPLYQIKGYYDCIFDGSGINLPVLVLSSGTPVVVLTAEDMAAAELKRAKIQREMERTRPVPKTKFVIPPPIFSGQSQPTLSDRLIDFLKDIYEYLSSPGFPKSIKNAPLPTVRG